MHVVVSAGRVNDADFFELTLPPTGNGLLELTVTKLPTGNIARANRN